MTRHCQKTLRTSWTHDDRKSIEPPNSEICLTRFLVIGPGVGCSGGLLTGQHYLESVVLVGGAEDVVGHLDFV